MQRNHRTSDHQIAGSVAALQRGLPEAVIQNHAIAFDSDRSFAAPVLRVSVQTNQPVTQLDETQCGRCAFFDQSLFSNL